MRKFFGYLFLSAVLSCATNMKCMAQRKDIQVVDGSVLIESKQDLHVSGADAFTETGTIDIRDADAVVFFDNVKPSRLVEEYLHRVYVNGQEAENDVNVRVGIYLNGSCIYPHGNSGYKPLTVYSDKGFEGTISSDYLPNEYYRSLGDMNNCISSFKLKRGYMATFATTSDGTGYSRCFIAQDADVQVEELDNLLNDKISFIRVLPWQCVSKKGNAGWNEAQFSTLNCSWFYGWNGDNYSRIDHEYVPQRVSIWWPSYDVLESRVDVTHLLGNNEPDYKDENGWNVSPEEVADKWYEMTRAGLRIGSPAIANNLDGWLKPFMKRCEENNYRVDFIAVHWYWYATGQSYSDAVNNYYNMFGRPIWLTEFNYGANWTEEKWPDADRTATEKNMEHQKKGLSEIVEALEANPHLERYAIYNWVEDCRSLYLDDAPGEGREKLTPAGIWYADHKSNMSYRGGEGYVPTWNYRKPEDFVVEYSQPTKSVSFSWTSKNGEQTDSTWLERKTEKDDDFKCIASFINTDEGRQTKKTYSYDDISDIQGIVVYRVRNFDSDGKSRFSGEVSVSIGRAEGDENFNWGHLYMIDNEPMTISFSHKFESLPAVFMGVYSNNNPKLGTGNLISSVTTSDFTYSLLPWKFAQEQSPANPEEVDYMAVKEGRYSFGDMEVEVGNRKVRGDTTEIVFDKPFPEGVVPVVIAELRKPVLKSDALSIKIWDVTERGFKCKLLYEYGHGKKVSVGQNMVYIAVTPGSESLGNGKILSAGVGAEKPYSVFPKKIDFITGSDNQPTKLYNPMLFAALQTCNLDAATLLRRTAFVEETDGATVGVRLKRQLDSSNEEASSADKIASADVVGWITLSDDLEHVDIDKVEISVSEEPLDIEVVNRIIYVKNADSYNVYTIGGVVVSPDATQEPGIYVVKSHSGQTAKVLVK